MSLGKRTFWTTPLMREYIDDILETGRLSYGKYSREFETRFAQMHDCKYGVLSNSGTSSLLVALQTLKELHGWRDGDEVIVPALTFVATVNVVLQLRLKPVLVDIEQDYYGIDVSQIEQAITDKTRCIIPVHAFGQLCDIAKIYYDNTVFGNMCIIEDSCEAMLVKQHDIWPSRFSDIACYSTYIAHLLVTGVGGLSTTNNPEYAQYMRSLVNHGIDLSELPTGEQYDTTWFNRKFSFNKVGHSFRLTEIEAAIGLAQLDDLADIIKQRQSNAAYLSAGLSDLEDRELLQIPHTRPNTENSHMMYPLVCLQDGVRDNLMRYLNENGIGTRLALPLIRQPVYKGLWEPENYPVADWMDKNAFYVGSHQGLSQEDLDYMINTVQDFYASR